MDVILLDELSEKIDSIGTLVETNNTANAAGTVSQKLTYIASSLIGTTAQTGGTTTSGTVMAKLNALLAANTNHGSKTFTSSGTWTCPAGVSIVYVTAVGGGGGGGGGGGAACVRNTYQGKYYQRSGGAGGSGGAGQFMHAIVNVTPNTSYTVTVGSGGTAGAGGVSSMDYGENTQTSGSNGGAGGETKFGNLVCASGGGGGGGGQTIVTADTTSSIIGGVAGAAGAAGALNINYVIGMINYLNGSVGKVGSSGKIANNYGSSEPVASVAGGLKVNGYLSAGYGGAGGASGSATYGDYGLVAKNASAGDAGGKGKLILVW